MKNVLVNVELRPEKLAELKSLPGLNVTVVQPLELEPHSLPDQMLKDIHILFCLTPPSNFEAMKSLEFIQICSAGYSQLFGLGLAEKKIKAANGQGVSDVPIAEWCITMMVNLIRNLRGLIRNQESRVWECSPKYQKEIRGSVLGIWGYGSIGRETARMAKNMGMKVVVFDRVITRASEMPDFYRVAGTGDPEGVLPDAVFLPGQEMEFLNGLDFLVLTMPLTNKTLGIIGEKELQALPPHAFILNPARGSLIVEEALLKALREGWIAGAALDTHYYYPMPADHPLWCFPNVIFTPHISGTALRERSWDIFLQNVERHLAGKPLMNELNATKLSGE